MGGWKAFYAFQNRSREGELWDWKTTQTLFGHLVIPVTLYGCELWASSASNMQWRQIEKIQKRLITNKFEIKSAVPYDILLSETGTAPIEAIPMVRVIRYLKKFEQMEEGRWLRLSLMIDCARVKNLGCNKITNGLINGVLLECVSHKQQRHKSFCYGKVP